LCCAEPSGSASTSLSGWRCRPRTPRGVVERFGGEGARDALRDLAAPHRIDDGHVRFGYLFQCITVRRDP
jgi:hypothetical protein